MNETCLTSPLLGFDLPLKGNKSTIKNKIINKVLKCIELQLNIYTSTPSKSALNVTAMSFSKSYEEISRTYLHTADNDSGYASVNQESNHSEVTENYLSGNVTADSVYLNEDAYLEKPMSAKKLFNVQTEDVYEEFSHLYYANTIIDSSVSVETKLILSGLDDSVTSVQSEMSDILPLQEPIVLAEDNISTFNSNVYRPLNDCIIRIEDSFNDTNTESNANLDINNIENNSNFINISNNFQNNTNRSNEKIVSDLNKIKINKTKTKSSPRKRKRSLSKTPKKLYNNSFNADRSPDLFSDEDALENSLNIPQNLIAEEKYIIIKDHILLKRINKTLSGVLPPPSLTTNNLTVDQILAKIASNKQYFWDVGNVKSDFKSNPLTEECTNTSLNTNMNTSLNNSMNTSLNNSMNTSSSFSCRITNSYEMGESASLLVNTNLETCEQKKWPYILDERYHGLHHNRSKLSEEIESLSMKYCQRYIGEETQSSCTIFDNRMSSPSKRKANRLRWQGRSPGRRLSHLARRRITFSSANLQVAGSGTTAASRQIMVDAKRFELLQRKKSPRKLKSPRKTPRKSPRKRIKTPSSSTKKNIAFRVKLMSAEDEAGPSTSSIKASVTKRALFQSPDHKGLTANKISKPVLPSTSNSVLSPWKKKNSLKSASFTSPATNSPSKSNAAESNKRKRLDSSDDFHPSKLPRSLSLEVGSSNTMNSNSKLLSRVRSEISLSSQSFELSAHHRKKLQWAIYEALRSHNIGIGHAQFKQFASVLGRVTRKFLPNLASTGPRPEGGTSGRMLRIAKQHVFAVIKGRTVDEIIQHHYESLNSKVAKPSGYVSLEQSKRMDVSLARKETAFQDKANTINSMDKLNIMPNTNKSENKVERVRKVINFDDNSSGGLFR